MIFGVCESKLSTFRDGFTKYVKTVKVLALAVFGALLI